MTWTGSLKSRCLKARCTGRSIFDLARAAEQFDDVVVAELREVQVLDLVGAVDLVQGERLRRRQVDRLAGGHGLDLGGEDHAQRLEPGGNADLVDRLAVLEEREVRDLHRGRDVVVIDRRDAQLDVLEQLE